MVSLASLTIRLSRALVTGRRRCRIRHAAAIVLAGILVGPSDVAAQRVRDEVVELSNGDRVTGEIKGLDRAQLTVRTIDLGTVKVRWQRVVRLNSNRTLEIELGTAGVCGARCCRRRQERWMSLAAPERHRWTSLRSL